MLKTKLLILTETMSALGSIYKIVYLYLQTYEQRAQGLDSVHPPLGAQLPRHSVPEANPLTSLTLGFFICEMRYLSIKYQ